MVKITRAGKAGISLGEAVIEMVHLMYQKNTALHFFKGLKSKVDEEINRREAEANEGK